MTTEYNLHKMEQDSECDEYNITNNEKKPYRSSDRVLYFTFDCMYPNLMLKKMPFVWFQFIFKDRPVEEMKSWLGKINSKLQKVINSGKKSSICPKLSNIWRWLEFMDPEEVKVIILGQDPYYSIKESIRASNGLGFSMNPKYFRRFYQNEYLPWTWNSITKMACGSEAKNYLRDGDGDLTSWYRQGVLMFDLYLTTMENQTEAHNKFGWTYITELLISRLGVSTEPRRVFMFWRKDFKNMFSDYVDNERHKLIFRCHPSSWRPNRNEDCSHGCWSDSRKNCFKKANRFLARLDPPRRIEWNPLEKI